MKPFWSGRPFAALALGAVLCAPCGCRHEAEPTKTVTPVRLEAVSALVTAAGIRYSATIRPREQMTLSWKAAGYVASIRSVAGADGRARALQAGDLVRKGDVLARLRDADYRERLSQARGAVAEAEAAETRARLDLERAEKLFSGKALTKPDLDGARAAREAAAARLSSARAQAATGENALADTSLVAPAGAMVLARTMEEGSLVNVGSPGFVLADTRAVKAVFGVPDLMVAHLSPGQPLDLVAEAVPGVVFRGKVTAVSPSADTSSRVFDVEVTIPNEEGRLKSGMIAAVHVARGEAAGAPASVPGVSLTAVLKSTKTKDGYAVYVADVTGDTAVVHLRDVSLGEISGNRIAVTGGLRVDERVVVAGTTLVHDGETVRVIP